MLEAVLTGFGSHPARKREMEVGASNPATAPSIVSEALAKELPVLQG